MTHKTRPGSPSPLGATWDGSGTNFAIYSEHATGIELCLVDHLPGRDREEVRISLRAKTDHVWHVYVEGIAPGQHYAYRVDGPWDPHQGQRFNKQSRLLDPWARAVAGVEDWDAGAFSYDLSRDDLVRNDHDQRAAPLGIVIDSAFDWEGDTPPNVAFADAVIYEAHVKGLTQLHPHVPAELRGSYAALASEPVIRHLQELGVTSLELLPIHHFVDDKFLLDKGLRNYWGYNTIAFFAPDPRYRSGTEPGCEVRELKQAVKTLHKAGIEVILDVVYNHTAEGNHQGPTFSLKGIDNRTYYRLVGDDLRHYFDYTGTGNTLDTRHPQSLRLVMDSLRYWIEEIHVDGFRFDLASTLARTQHEVDRLSSFFTIIKQDPVISRVKLIAEPWDVGDGGYQVGRFPMGWSEWNGMYRDTLREFWRGDGSKSAGTAGRIAGSADLYQSDGRSPWSSVNLIVAHDGFTLRDLVSYNHKHNDANGEGNRDGADNDASWNCGAEGETEDAGITRLRWRQMRNFLATLLLSQGTPMLCGGDELGRTQHGNNNAYCQDNETSWFDWNLSDEQRRLLEFTRKVIRLRASHPVFRRAGFFQGQIAGLDIPDALWLRHDGQPMRDEDWHNAHTSSFVMFLAGAGNDRVDARGEPVLDDDFLIAFNASGAELELTLPSIHDRAGEPWQLVLDTFDDDAHGHREADTTTPLRGRSIQVYRRTAPSRHGSQAIDGAPSSTYRLQLHAGFTFADTAAITDYLAQLGVGAIYTSPYSRAERGSMHGYNVIDHATLNPEIGDAEAHGALIAKLRDHGLGHILDFVPNHVGVGAGENRWWIDVLENGPASLYADFFDIDWLPPTPGLANRLLLPVLGEQYGAELEAGKLSIVFEYANDRASFAVAYYDRRWPIAPRTSLRILDLAVELLTLHDDDLDLHDLKSIRTAISHVPLPSETAPESRQERAREKEVIKRRLGELCTRSTEIRSAIEAALLSKNPTDKGPGDIEWLDALLADQNYRLAYWRVASEEVNYRRFFDINELAAIRMEDPRVFEATHTLVLDLVASGAVTGLRLDHTDGLYEPQVYFRLLQDRLRAARKVTQGDTYVLAEKILEHGEVLPRSWPIAGTTGYDFLAVINGQWVDASATQQMTEIYTKLTGEPAAFAPSVFTAKRAVLDTTFSAEIIKLGQALRNLAETDRRSRDFTLYALTTGIKDTLAAFPVYRTYLAPGGSREPNDEGHVEHAIALAKRKNRGIDPSVLDYLRDVLLLRIPSPQATHIAMRFQQLSGPVMAKGVEDTAFYRYHRLASLTDVGCDPARFGASTEELHAHNTAMLAAFPLTMTTTTTHDTKRSEDVRTRIAVLSELPDEWEARATRWLERARHCCSGDHCPTPNDLYLLFQTLLGAWPLTGDIDGTFRDRIDTYMRKAMREAKVSTSWTRPDETYEQGMTKTIHCLLDDLGFRADLANLAQQVTPYGACNSLAQVAVKLAAPGVPDIYQGTELWDLSLVDPDNRRPVDFARRRELLSSLGEPSTQLATDLVTHFLDGRIKLHVTRVGLQLRRQDPMLFLEGGYHALDAGPHAIAFLRSRGSTRLACIAPRLPRTLTRGERPFPLGDVWGDRNVELPAATWKNVFTGERFEGTTLALRDVLATFPVAWLLAE